MNKICTTIFLMLVISLASCTDLTGVKSRLNDHEQRLKALEDLVTNANTNIQNLQKLLDAEAKKITIVSFDETPDGYVLNMSDGSKITLNNGTDGTTPAIGMKEENGVLYWTINGEFMLDADGNKIKAEGQDGANGVSPKIRVDAEGYWEVSLDGGKTWQAITDTNGQKVKAVGSDATIDLVITEDENAITIVYDGNTFVIPKNGTTPNPQPDPQPDPINRPYLPIDYVTEYNIQKGGEGFTDSHDNDKSGYFTWDEAMNLNLEGYHVPSRYEWAAIIPTFPPDGYDIYLSFTSESLNPNVTEAAEFEGKKFSHASDFRTYGNDKTGYALRFKKCDVEVVPGYLPIKDNKLLCAYKYEVVGKHAEKELNSHLKITVRYLGEEFTGTIDDISNETFWADNSENDIVRIFPSATYYHPQKHTETFGYQAFYWSSTPADFEGYSWNMCYMEHFAYVNYNHNSFGFSVRMFKNTMN